jgi:hypothetical protein|tara:strand:+ start:160 stop:363 length:204 start_codon:yes stop_codon:yes gene_type:complete
MPKKKPKKSRKYKYVVSPNKPIERLDIIEIDISPESRMLRGPDKKPTLHAKGGLVKGKPKLAKRGWK